MADGRICEIIKLRETDIGRYPAKPFGAWSKEEILNCLIDIGKEEPLHFSINLADRMSELKMHLIFLTSVDVEDESRRKKSPVLYTPNVARIKAITDKDLVRLVGKEITKVVPITARCRYYTWGGTREKPKFAGERIEIGKISGEWFTTTDCRKSIFGKGFRILEVMPDAM